MSKLNGVKTLAVGTIAFLSISAITMGNAFAQDSQKPVPRTDQKTEQTSGCACCKKMMENMMKDRTNPMPGMNHSTSTSK